MEEKEEGGPPSNKPKMWTRDPRMQLGYLLNFSNSAPDWRPPQRSNSLPHPLPPKLQPQQIANQFHFPHDNLNNNHHTTSNGTRKADHSVVAKRRLSEGDAAMMDRPGISRKRARTHPSSPNLKPQYSNFDVGEEEEEEEQLALTRLGSSSSSLETAFTSLSTSSSTDVSDGYEEEEEEREEEEDDEDGRGGKRMKKEKISVKLPPRARRKRVTPEQKKVLEASFAICTHPSRAEKDRLGRQLDMTTMQVQSWFHNNRTKMKKQKNPTRG